jgi:GST-like protein
MHAITDIAPVSTAIFLATMVFPEKVPSVTSFFEKRFLGFCAVVDRRLGEGEYLAGKEFSIAEIALYPVIAGRQALVDKAPGLANLKRWAAALAARPTIQRALKVAT